MKPPLHTSCSARHDFATLLVASTLSWLGDTLLVTVIALRIAASGQPWRLTVIYIAFAVPLFVLAPIAGRIVDEFDSRRVLVLAGLTQSAAAVGIALSSTFPLLVAAVVALQAGQAVSAPAWSALVPRIVGAEAVGRATGRLSAAGAIAGMAGTAMGGFLYGPLGFRGAVLINAAGFVAISVAGVLVGTRRGRRVDVRAQAQPAASMAAAVVVDADLVRGVLGPEPGSTAAPDDGPDAAVARPDTGGWAFCRRDAVLATLLPALWALVVVGEALNVAEVFLIRGVLGATATLYGICGAVFLSGSIVGPLLAGRVADDRSRIRWCAVTAALFGAMVVLIGVSPSAWIVVGLGAVAGVLIGALNALIVAVILVRPPEEIRGRVMAMVNGTMRGFTIAAVVLGGVLVGVVGARVTFAILGALVAGTAVLIRRVVKAVPEVDDRWPADPAPAD